MGIVPRHQDFDGTWSCGTPGLRTHLEVPHASVASLVTTGFWKYQTNARGNELLGKYSVQVQLLDQYFKLVILNFQLGLRVFRIHLLVHFPQFRGRIILLCLSGQKSLKRLLLTWKGEYDLSQKKRDVTVYKYHAATQPI